MLTTLAEVLVRHCTRVRPGEVVTVVADDGCIPATRAVHKSVLNAGAHPSFHPRSEDLRELLLTHADDDQLRHVCPLETHRLAVCDVLIVLSRPGNTRRFTRFDPARLAAAGAARRELLALSMARAARGEMRYCLTEIPGDAAAQEAEMSLSQYERFVFRAGFLDLPDPVGAWRTLQDQQTRAVEDLSRCSTLRFVSPSSGRTGATDLTVDVSGRTWLNRAGDENFPDGEIETGPRGAEGIVAFDHPCVYRGCRVEGVRLRFSGGRVVDASARANEPFLHAMLDQDPGARVMGEIALGTNYRIDELTGSPFFDEKIAGTFHLALGASYPRSGLINHSSLHWDMVGDLRRAGAVYADGELIQRHGHFTRQGWPAPL